jgi:hypothetical protein
VAFDVLAVVLTQAKIRMAQMLETGKSFKITHFAVSAEGHDPADPTIALTPDPADTTCDGVIFTKAFVPADVTYLSPTCPSWACNLLPGDVTGAVSQICLIGTVEYCPDVLDPECVAPNTTFVVAKGNMPLKIITIHDTVTFNVAIQF